MIKKISMSFFVLFTSIAFAQNKSDIDSLYLVKDYLLGIRSTVNVENCKEEEQLIKVSRLIEKGKKYETQFPLWLETAINPDSGQYKEIVRQFKLILQTLALYNSDLKAKPEQRPANHEDLEFLNIRIPRLVDDIYHYCKVAEEERLKKIH